jgi:hypothetical protein
LTAQVTARSRGLSARGKLRLSGDMICTRFHQIRAGVETCFTVTRTGYGYKTSHGGTLRPI